MKVGHREVAVALWVVRIVGMYISLAGTYTTSAWADESDIPDDIAIAAFAPEIADDSLHVVLCLEVGGSSASDAVLHALARPDRTIVPASECQAVIEPSGSFHIPSNRPAHIISLSDFKLDGPARASLKVKGYFNGKWGWGWTLDLVQQEGNWKILRRYAGFVA